MAQHATGSLQLFVATHSQGTTGSHIHRSADLDKSRPNGTAQNFLSSYSTKSSFGPRHYSSDTLEHISYLSQDQNTVSKVKDKRNGLIFARKTIFPEKHADAGKEQQQQQQQLMHELEAAAKTHAHTNIVDLFGYYYSSDNDILCRPVEIVMEYCEGGSLDAIIHRMQTTVTSQFVREGPAAIIAHGILQGLAHLHSQGAVHGDIRPSTVLFAYDGTVKLCGFHLASEKIAWPHQKAFRAPEAWTEKTLDIRSDVWSAALTVLTFLIGSCPVNVRVDSTLFQTMRYQAVHAPPAPMYDNNALGTLSNSTKDFFAKALSDDGSKRPTPQELISHPWIIDGMEYNVDMDRWMRGVLGWQRVDTSRTR